MKLIGQREIAVGDIVVGERLRKTSPEWVATLAELIKTEGLLEPVGVRALGGGKYKLTVGAHRLEAVKSLELPTIRCETFEAETDNPEDEERVHEIIENVGRSELSALDRAANLAVLKAIYERQNPETKRGVAGGKARQKTASDKLSFAETASEKTGLSARQIQRAVQVHNGLTDEVRAIVRELPIAENESQLRALSMLDKTQQSRAAKLLKKGTAQNVAGARAILDGTAAQPSENQRAFEALVKAWERAPGRARTRFLKEINATLEG